MKQRSQLYLSDKKQKLEQNYPKVNSYVDTFVEVWKETFPNQKEQAKQKLDDRKKRVKMVKEAEAKMAQMTPEEIEAYE